jgi:hypothetical protein
VVRGGAGDRILWKRSSDRVLKIDKDRSFGPAPTEFCFGFGALGR